MAAICYRSIEYKRWLKNHLNQSKIFIFLIAVQFPVYAETDTATLNTDVVEITDWDMQAIRDSHIVNYQLDKLGNTPVHDADPLNLFFVIEKSDHHATILEGSNFKVIHRFKTRPGLHGVPKFSADGRFVYLSSRDGWISKFDLYQLKIVAEIKVGIDTRNLALSNDGRFIIAGNNSPHTLVVLDALYLAPLKMINVRNDQGLSSRVSAVYDGGTRNSFLVALKDIREIWELVYDEKAEPIYNGMVHDYRYSEGVAEQGPFPVRRIRLDDYLEDFFFDNKFQHLIGVARNTKNIQVINLIVGRKIADIELNGLPHPSSAISWDYQGKSVIAIPNMKVAAVDIIDVSTWKLIKKINTGGPGFFLRSHKNSLYSWADVFFGPNKDLVHIIEKSTLNIVKTIQPSPGNTAAHVEFTRDGGKALLSVWADDGAIIVYDADSLEELKRVKMKRPAGKYNVYNRISRANESRHQAVN